MLDNDDESLEDRLWFMQQVLAPDDIYDFADLLLQMNFVLSNALHEFTNLETVMEVNPTVKKVLKNLVEFRLRMKYKDTRIIQLEKFDLSN